MNPFGLPKFLSHIHIQFKISASPLSSVYQEDRPVAPTTATALGHNVGDPQFINYEMENWLSLSPFYIILESTFSRGLNAVVVYAKDVALDSHKEI